MKGAELAETLSGTLRQAGLVAPFPHLVAETVRRERLVVRRHEEGEIAARARRDDAGEDRQDRLVGHVIPNVAVFLGTKPIEKIDSSLDQAKFFQTILLAKESGRNVPRSIGLAAEEVIGETVGEIYLARDIRRGVKFVFRATSLMNGMWIQLTQSILGDVKIRSCEFCGAFFDVGVGTDRRADARFCSKPHQVEFNSRKRSKAS
jgi:hypothetical protein